MSTSGQHNRGNHVVNHRGHGIAQQYRGPNYLAAAWLSSLQDGVGFAGGVLDPQDFAMAFYGDLFRDPETMSAMFPPLDASDLDDPEDAELLDLLWSHRRIPSWAEPS
jgi:hypothetical protein